MPTPRWYFHGYILGKRIEFLRGNVAWEFSLGLFYVQVFYRPYRKAFGFVKVGRWRRCS